jgi:hypothetical protein
VLYRIYNKSKNLGWGLTNGNIRNLNRKVIKRAPWQQTQFNKNLVGTKRSTKLDKTNSNTSKRRNKNEKMCKNLNLNGKE